jgi:hypothetical protein
MILCVVRADGYRENLYFSEYYGSYMLRNAPVYCNATATRA